MIRKADRVVSRCASCGVASAPATRDRRGTVIEHLGQLRRGKINRGTDVGRRGPGEDPRRQSTVCGDLTGHLTGLTGPFILQSDAHHSEAGVETRQRGQETAFNKRTNRLGEFYPNGIDSQIHGCSVMAGGAASERDLVAGFERRGLEHSPALRVARARDDERGRVIQAAGDLGS